MRMQEGEISVKMLIMSAENSPMREDIARGGCLDSLVTTVTLGKYGVETTRRFGIEDAWTGEFFQEHPNIRAFKTGKPVAAHYWIDEPKITRKVIRNK